MDSFSKSSFFSVSVFSTAQVPYYNPLEGLRKNTRIYIGEFAKNIVPSCCHISEYLHLFFQTIRAFVEPTLELVQ